MGSEIQTTVKANELSSVMTVCLNGFLNDVIICMHANWLKYYPMNFSGVGSFYGNIVFMLKFQTR